MPRKTSNQGAQWLEVNGDWVTVHARTKTLRRLITVVCIAVLIILIALAGAGPTTLVEILRGLLQR